jgi:hypothetical protein
MAASYLSYIAMSISLLLMPYRDAKLGVGPGSPIRTGWHLAQRIADEEELRRRLGELRTRQAELALIRPTGLIGRLVKGGYSPGQLIEQ